MKLIFAILRREKLAATLKALYRADVRGVTVVPVQGHGGETEAVETYRGTTVKVELHDKVQLQIAVTEPFVDATIAAIVGAAHTGDVGDGKVFVLPIERAVRIRTGEEDQDAITPVGHSA